MGLRKGQTNSGSFNKGDRISRSTEFKKGERRSIKTEFGNKPPWNKGLKGSSYKKHYKNGMKNLIKPGHIPHNKGKQKPTTPLRKAIRQCFKMRSWVNSCYIRDDFTCQECGERGGKLSVHHIIHFQTLLRVNNIKSFQDAIECDDLWNQLNGITLCIKCHKKRHKQEGYRR